MASRRAASFVLALVAACGLAAQAALLRSQRPFEDDVFLYNKPQLMAHIATMPAQNSSASSARASSRAHVDSDWAESVGMGRPMPTKPR